MVTGQNQRQGTSNTKSQSTRQMAKGAGARAKHKQKGIILPALTAPGGAKPSRALLLHTWQLALGIEDTMLGKNTNKVASLAVFRQR